MSTRTELLAKCARTTKTSGDTTASNGFIDDINEAIKLIASKRDWVELWREGTIVTASTDGDKAYALNSDVAKVYQMRVTLPNSFIRELDYRKNFDQWRYAPTKANQGTSPISAWYFTAPTTNTDGSMGYNISFDQKPDQAYTVVYSYKVKTPLLTSGSQVPFFDENFHEILHDYAVWRYAEREADPSLNPNYWATKWALGEQALMSSVQTRQRDQVAIPGP